MTFSPDVLRLNPHLAGTETPTAKPSKFHNAKAEAAGMTFQSGHEAAVIGQLIMLEERRQGVFGLRLQVRFPLGPDESYIADATYADEHLVFHVVDTKNWNAKKGEYFLTREYRHKRRLFKKYYPGHEIEEL